MRASTSTLITRATFALTCQKGLKAFLRGEVGNGDYFGLALRHVKNQMPVLWAQMKHEAPKWRWYSQGEVGGGVAARLTSWHRTFQKKIFNYSLPTESSQDWAHSFAKSWFPKEQLFCGTKFGLLIWQRPWTAFLDAPTTTKLASFSPIFAFLRPEVPTCPPQGGAGQNSLQDKLDSLGHYTIRVLGIWRVEGKVKYKAWPLHILSAIGQLCTLRTLRKVALETSIVHPYFAGCNILTAV